MLPALKKFAVEWSLLVVVAMAGVLFVDMALVLLGLERNPYVNVPDDALALAGGLIPGLLVWKLLAPHKEPDESA